MLSLPVGNRTPSTSDSPPPKYPEKVDGPVDTPVDGQNGKQREQSTVTVHFSAENSLGGRCGRSDQGKDKEGRKIFVLLPGGGMLPVPSLDMAPDDATAWCWEGDSFWTPMNGQAQM